MDDAAFDVSVRRSVQLSKLLMERGGGLGFFAELGKSMLMLYMSGQEKAAKS